ncbi:ciliary microtubule inner protein 1 [Ascaphus truei]|uniref:ciliary microtubule inner protein 1 n=1 Tax=Ascaphus truei TaxID=8439 RepID=UPI003F5ACE0F
MAAPQHSPKLGKQCNFVAKDNIWKSHIKTEVESAKKWPGRWGFLATSYKELVKDETEGKEERVRLKTPEHLKVRPVTPVETYIQVGPSPAVPQTTQGLIGWRSTVPGLQLDRYGTSKYLKGDFCKKMNWPAEGVS